MGHRPRMKAATSPCPNRLSGCLNRCTGFSANPQQCARHTRSPSEHGAGFPYCPDSIKGGLDMLRQLKSLPSAIVVAATVLMPLAASAQVSEQWQFGAQLYAYLPSLKGTANFPAQRIHVERLGGCRHAPREPQLRVLRVVRGEERPLGRVHRPDVRQRRRQQVRSSRLHRRRHPDPRNGQCKRELRPQGLGLDDRSRIRCRRAARSNDGRLCRRTHARSRTGDQLGPVGRHRRHPTVPGAAAPRASAEPTGTASWG